MFWLKCHVNVQTSKCSMFFWYWCFSLFIYLCIMALSVLKYEFNGNIILSYFSRNVTWSLSLLAFNCDLLIVHV